ncbi:TPA: hypothetical protein H1005_00675 [archaeon]|uniref:Uncharacterized protein n=1 Tax=Candidatus Naiadarchaeum limnaeum TaxID=2756139 RepID=A0A832X6F7_9ARCH|nr:hypothetical protein [Candidatus Naiadarchaeales archaeon SRR2090153.bin1042]HIK00815.1 hypothetical protein [Candidatus Naiadarchaeum limnaeum]
MDKEIRKKIKEIIMLGFPDLTVPQKSMVLAIVLRQFSSVENRDRLFRSKFFREWVLGQVDVIRRSTDGFNEAMLINLVKSIFEGEIEADELFAKFPGLKEYLISKHPKNKAFLDQLKLYVSWHHSEEGDLYAVIIKFKPRAGGAHLLLTDDKTSFEKIDIPKEYRDRGFGLLLFLGRLLFVDKIASGETIELHLDDSGIEFYSGLFGVGRIKEVYEYNEFIQLVSQGLRRKRIGCNL